MTRLSIDPGSFRDPRGHVYWAGNRVFRTILEPAARDYEFARSSGLTEKLIAAGLLIQAKPADLSSFETVGDKVCYFLEHPRIPFISYPYEWCFTALKAAALTHLDIQLQALEHNVALSDASAYNLQFIGTRPVFIDYLSFRPYREGEVWIGHRQFCEQFLNPLLLNAVLGISHNAWYRGNQEGIATQDISKILPLGSKLDWNMLMHVVLQSSFQRLASKSDKRSMSNAVQQINLPVAGFRRMLVRLRTWIERLRPRDKARSVWANYPEEHSYASEEMAAKRRFVASFALAAKPPLVWDLGCNIGEFSRLMLDYGAGYVVGFDYDLQALDRGFAGAQSKGISFLPLYMDAANPSPSQGWSQVERQGVQARAGADAILALAFVHHLAIGRNVPLKQVVDWLVGLAPCGVIEFVPKNDPMVQQMLRLREDIFADYHQEAFLAYLSAHARVLQSETISSTGRQLIWFDRA